MFTNQAIKCFRDVFRTQGKTSLNESEIQYLKERSESPSQRFESISYEIQIQLFDVEYSAH